MTEYFTAISNNNNNIVNYPIEGKKCPLEYGGGGGVGGFKESFCY